MLETLNVWVDTAGFVIAAAVTLGFIIPHFIASIVTGRVRKGFIENYWAPLAHRMHDPKQYHYRQPLSPDFPAPIRIWHWVNIVSFLALLITGLYVRYPWFEGGHAMMRLIHYVFMYVITINLIFRFIYLYIAGNWRDYLTFDAADIPWAVSVAKYYIFIGPPYDHLKKFNPLQRPAYPAFWAMLSLQAITGFIIWRPGLAGPLVGLFGGPADIGAWMRLIHQINLRLMMVLAIIHSYLGTMADYPVLEVFWFWKEPNLAKYDEEDHGDHGDHGDGDHGQPAPQGADGGEPQEPPAH